MAQKTIPELTEISTPDLDAVLPIDTGIQTYKTKVRNLLRHSAADVVVGIDGSDVAEGCTHKTLELALADSGVVDGMRVLLTQSFNIAAKITISKSLHIEALPGVTATKTGGTVGLELDDTGITIKGLRFAGYTVAGNKAIACTALGVYARVHQCNFAVGTDTDIDDSLVAGGKKPLAVLNHYEV